MKTIVTLLTSLAVDTACHAAGSVNFNNMAATADQREWRKERWRK